VMRSFLFATILYGQSVSRAMRCCQVCVSKKNKQMQLSKLLF
jgi:hypothetical protein